MSDYLKGDVWLVGCGGMAQAYAAVLESLHIEPRVIGRGEASAKSFEAATGIPVERGGIEGWLRSQPESPTFVIIAVNVMELARTAAAIATYCDASLLVEKPGFVTGKDVDFFPESALDRVYIAYNRRYFASSLHVSQQLALDGGASGGFFEFTEWGHRIASVLDRKNPDEMAHWLLANSSHVIDLAFHLLGTPATLHSTVKGTISWHPTGSSFAGSGKTQTGAIFSYLADWTAPGRWWLDVSSCKRRFRMCPLEAVEVQELGEITWRPIQLNDVMDRQFKPGLFAMISDFLSATPSGRLCTARSQLEMLPHYRKMAGYF